MPRDSYGKLILITLQKVDKCFKGIEAYFLTIISDNCRLFYHYPAIRLHQLQDVYASKIHIDHLTFLSCPEKS